MQMQSERLESARTFVAAKVTEICETISRETQSLAPTKEVRYSISSAPASMLSLSLQASSLRDRMFTFLRLVDLHVGESIFRHLETFLLAVFVQVCGGEGVVSDKSDAVPHVAELEVDENGKDPDARALHEFRVRFRLKSSESLFPVLCTLLEDDVDFSPVSTSASPTFRLSIAPSKTIMLEILYRLIGDYMAALDDSPVVVRAALLAS